MNEADVRKIVREEFLKLIPELFGRSLVQIRAFFTRTIV